MGEERRGEDVQFTRRCWIIMHLQILSLKKRLLTLYLFATAVMDKTKNLIDDSNTPS